MTSRDERKRRVRQLTVQKIKREARMRRVAELKRDQTGGIVFCRGMSRAQRMAVAAHLRRHSSSWITDAERAVLKIKHARDEIRR